MASPLLLAPLLLAQLAVPVHGREVRQSGLVIRATATQAGDVIAADIDVRGRAIGQHIQIVRRGLTVQTLLDSIQIVDADFDGRPDVVVLRERTPQGRSLDVFLFDNTTRQFSMASPVAKALSNLTNASFDPAHKTIATHETGPVNPSRATYMLGHGGRELEMVDGCRFVNPSAERIGTLIRTHLGHSTYAKLRLAPSDVDPCGP